MKAEKIIEHITEAVNTWIDKDKYWTKEEFWKDLIVRESKEKDEFVEILFDGGMAYDLINETWSECGYFNDETADELFGLKSLEKKGHYSEPYASWKISVYNWS
jgi:hypothetical protein